MEIFDETIISDFAYAELSDLPKEPVSRDNENGGVINAASLMFETESGAVRQAAALLKLQPPQDIAPPTDFQPAAQLPTSTANLSQSLFGTTRPASFLASRRRPSSLNANANLILGIESKARVTTDVGNLIRKSPAALGVNVQQRNPIVSEPRVRGGRIGSLHASGSHWIPARLDLDTMMSKIDSRLIDNVVVTKGPYTSRLGPGFDFVDFQLLGTPRYEDGYESHASLMSAYKVNGEQFYGRQAVWGGNQDWGFRGSYGHRIGNDYTAGDGTGVPSSYNSRDVDFSLGKNFGESLTSEFTYLRLDQTGLEFPGQAFDIDFLVTDGFEWRVTHVDQAYYDRLDVDLWYNRTRFVGNAQGSGKRRQIPFFDSIAFVGNTDVDSMSLGYTIAASWGDPDSSELTVGTDLRYLKQELNEITSGRRGFFLWTDANSPLPRSDSLDPGLFIEHRHEVSCRLKIKSGVRADFVQTGIIDDSSKLAAVGTSLPPSSYAELIGTDQYTQNFVLWAAHSTAEYEVNKELTLFCNGGYAERAPNLTELYIAESFMFLLQNGVNTVTGDPRLDRERNWQIDAGVRWNTDKLHVRLSGFHSWVEDYITFENTGVIFSGAGPEQVNLKYVKYRLGDASGSRIQCRIRCRGMVDCF